jgi:ATP-dependent helicase HrpA
LAKLLTDGSALADRARLCEQLAELIADRALFGEDETLPRTAIEFANRSLIARGELGRAVLEVLDVVRPLLHSYRRVAEVLSQTDNPRWRYAICDMQSQLARLTSPGFLANTPWHWLTEFPRYLRAMEIRLQKLADGGVARDEQLFAEIHVRQRACDELVASRHAHALYTPALSEYRWLLEELRVHLFAQSLGTKHSVSPQRLDALWNQALAQ